MKKEILYALYDTTDNDRIVGLFTSKELMKYLGYKNISTLHSVISKNHKLRNRYLCEVDKND